MAWADVIQYARGQVLWSTPATSITVSFGSTPTEGNLLLAYHFTGDADSQAPTGWTEAQAITEPASGYDQGALYYKVAGASEGTGVTATASGSNEHVMYIVEHEGPWATSGLLDVTYEEGYASSTSPTTIGPTSATTSADEMVCCIMGGRISYPEPYGGGDSFSAGWTKYTNLVYETQNKWISGAWKTVSSTGTQTATWDTANYYSAGHNGGIASFVKGSTSTTFEGSVTEGLDLSETTARSKTMTASVTEGLEVGGSPDRAATYPVSLAEGLEAGDLSTAVATLLGLGADAFELSESATTTVTLVGSASDEVRLSEAVVGLMTFVLAATDGFSLSELATANLFELLQGAVTEGVTFGESASVLAQLVTLASDSVDLSDSASVSFILTALLTEGLTAGDAASTTKTSSESVTEGLFVSDSALSRAIFVANVIDVFQLGDVLTALSILSAEVSEGFGINDTLLPPIIRAIISASTAEGVLVGDDPSATRRIMVSAGDQFSLSEATSVVARLVALASDAFQVSDVAFHVQAEGLVKIVLTIEGQRVEFILGSSSALATFSASEAGVNLSGGATSSFRPSQATITLDEET